MVEALIVLKVRLLTDQYDLYRSTRDQLLTRNRVVTKALSTQITDRLALEVEMVPVCSEDEQVIKGTLEHPIVLVQILAVLPELLMRRKLIDWLLDNVLFAVVVINLVVIVLLRRWSNLQEGNLRALPHLILNHLFLKARSTCRLRCLIAYLLEPLPLNQ